nr:MAG TPA: hypothetical protein [Caudoviricetes sp.]
MYLVLKSNTWLLRYALFQTFFLKNLAPPFKKLFLLLIPPLLS